MKIICILGKSGSGKTYAVDKLNPKKFHIVESWTTRPPRYDGETGHKFTTKEELGISTFDIENQKSAMYCTTLASTYINGEFYFVRREDLSEDKPNVYVIDEQGIEELKFKLPFEDIEVWYLDVSSYDCVCNMEKRGDEWSDIKKRILWEQNRFNMSDYADYLVNDSDVLAAALSSPFQKIWYTFIGKVRKRTPKLPKPQQPYI